MNKLTKEFAITLTPELYARLQSESRELDVPFEWLVASLVVDTLEVESPKPVAA